MPMQTKCNPSTVPSTPFLIQRRSNTVAVIRRPDIKVPVQASISVSSFNFVPKASRNKYTKEIREKKNEWKKKIM